MKDQSNYTIRRMTLDEVENIAVVWAAKEGWNPGLYDAPCFFEADNQGFFIGLLDDEPISCISIVNYGGDFAFLGFYIVKEGYRGKGYGLKIWNTALEFFASQNIGLDGVVDQQENYKKSGFVLGYNNIRHEGRAASIDEIFDDIIAITQTKFEDILQYDTAHFPVERAGFLRKWLDQPHSNSFAAVHDGKITGYGMIRKCREGYKIGPLFADNDKIAEKIFLRMNNAVEPGEKIFLDTPETNAAAIALAEKYNMVPVFETARMYTKAQPEINIDHIFGVTTFELG